MGSAGRWGGNTKVSRADCIPIQLVIGSGGSGMRLQPGNAGYCPRPRAAGLGQRHGNPTVPGYYNSSMDTLNNTPHTLQANHFEAGQFRCNAMGCY